eukprot:UN25265
MSRLLLDATPEMTGLGITLDPEEGGNVYPDDFNIHPRFKGYEYDVIKLALKPAEEISKILKIKSTESEGEFDLSIIGITIHQNFSEFDHLDHQVLYAQLYLTLLYLKDGGSLLIRHKMGLSLIHSHLLVLFLKIFRGTPACGKPMTEFAIRKTYWVLWKDFDRVGMIKSGLLDTVKTLLKDTVEGRKSGYDFDREKNCYYNPCFVSENVDEIVEKYGARMLEVQKPMWKLQSIALNSYFKGKEDKICGRYKCTGSNCTAAHCISDLIEGVYE